MLHEQQQQQQRKINKAGRTRLPSRLLNHTLMLTFGGASSHQGFGIIDAPVGNLRQAPQLPGNRDVSAMNKSLATS